MKTIGIDSNNDIYLDNSNNLGMKSDLGAMGDILVNKSQTVEGELIYDTEKGIDFFNTIFSSPCYPDLFQNQLLTQLEDTYAVQEVSGYTAETSDGVYSYKVNVQTDYGQIALNG